jgi:hypothetical protein
MLTNIIFFIGSHCTLKIEGRWIGIKDTTSFKLHLSTGFKITVKFFITYHRLALKDIIL